MVKKLLYCTLFSTGILSINLHAANPASTAYVDQKIAQLQAAVQTRLTQLQTLLTQLTQRAIPAGGLAGQVLAKTSNANYATGWQYTIGQHVLGGVVFFVYVDANGAQHGLVAATADEPGGAVYSVSAGISQCDTKSVVQNGITYTNWILPSQAQMSALYNNRYAIDPTSPNGGFSSEENPTPLNQIYWTSTPSGVTPNSYWGMGFGVGFQAFGSANQTFNIRCIRTF